MKTVITILLSLFFLFPSLSGNSQHKSNKIKPDDILAIMKKVADWQIAHPKSYNPLDWHYGAFYTGLMALYKTTQEPAYWNEMQKLGEANQWKLMNDIYHADRLTIAQTFAEMYLIHKDPKMLEKIQWVMDMHIDRTAKADVRFEHNAYAFEWWTWCDALYMAPPAFARVYKATGDTKYLDYLDKHWWITSDYLYDENEHLFYRDDRFFKAKTENGKKVFWSRGNGWVMGGLVRVLEYMPEDYPSRPKFVQQYQEMAEKIASIQTPEGFWTSSLLDTQEFPIGESSGTAFYCYALTWGINQGILAKVKYLPIVEKAWKALSKNVNPAGRLGFVQQVGDSPKGISEDDWEVYGSGAFLLAGCELYKLLKK
jgi:rhamnogalacturonyl hydrolase YesR